MNRKNPGCFIRTLRTKIDAAKCICFLCVALSIYPVSAQNKPLNLKYLGAAGWEMSEGGLTILVDPYLSRLKLGNGPATSKDDHRKSYADDDRYYSDTATIDKIIRKADYILVTHSHLDHLGDVPYIAKKTGAKVIATETSCNILRSYGIPEEQIYTVRGGEDYQFDNFSVKIIPSIHSALGKKHYFNSEIHHQALKMPLRLKDFIEGGTLMFLIRFPSHTLLASGSMNYIEKEVQGLRPDVIITGVNFSRLEIYKYTERLLKATGYPKTVIPTHWDNFRVPYGFSQEDAIEKKIKPFITEVKAASPASRVIVPAHLETTTIK